ncbi:21897_t:CDS:2 [Dentiscutata erythropus]|uniref:21897_t:CDS:1 n=1 Tax=Dentiscutata erythropus TaxID=1348616 RepID=A0A9N8WMY8_9GLOM|nr:21897_t:CDS:2 [Dentiscutata erythropus]
MTPETSITNEDYLPLIGSDTDAELQTSSDTDSINFVPSKQNDNSLSFSIFDSSSNPSRASSYKRKHSPYFYNKQNINIDNYPNVGELLWNEGKTFSDVRLTFEDKGVLANCAGIPSELRLHSVVLFQSQFFKEQLSQSPSMLKRNIINEKQIIVRLPTHVNEEDIINFYCTLKLIYTKKWDLELANNLSKGVGCLSVCCEIGFQEGIEACWKWLVRKCNRDRNFEMMKLLIDAYPNLHEKFTHQVEPVSKPFFNYSNLSRNPRSKRRSRRNNRPKHLYRKNSHDTSTSPTSATFSNPLVLSHTSHPFPVLSHPPTQFDNLRILNTWISKFESYSISSKRSCAKFPFEARDDNRCFPFIKRFSSVFDSINQLGRSKCITSSQCLDFALRMLNVIKIEHSHFHKLHIQPLNLNDDKSQNSSEEINNTTRKSLSSTNKKNKLLSSSSIILHESLDEPLSILLKEILSPVEQKHLCDYLWAPNSLVKGSRVSQVEHMVVGEKMVKIMREIMSSTS